MSDLRSSKLLNRLQRNFLLEHCCLFWIFSGLEILGVNSVSPGVLPDSFAAIQVCEIGSFAMPDLFRVLPCEVFRLLRYVEITDCRIYAPAVWRVPRAKEMFEKFEDEAPVTNNSLQGCPEARYFRSLKCTSGHFCYNGTMFEPSESFLLLQVARRGGLGRKALPVQATF